MAHLCVDLHRLHVFTFLKEWPIYVYIYTDYMYLHFSKNGSFMCRFTQITCIYISQRMAHLCVHLHRLHVFTFLKEWLIYVYIYTDYMYLHFSKNGSFMCTFTQITYI